MWDGSFLVPHDNCPLGIPGMPLALTVTLGHCTQARNWTPTALGPIPCEYLVSCNHWLLFAGVPPPLYSAKDS